MGLAARARVRGVGELIAFFKKYRYAIYFASVIVMFLAIISYPIIAIDIDPVIEWDWKEIAFYSATVLALAIFLK